MEPAEKEEEKGEVVEFPISRRRHLFIVASISSEYMVTGLLYSIMPPFYPKEAEDRGLKSNQYGFVFAIAHLSSMFASPIFGRYTGYMGPKCVYVTASVMQILCAGYLFGLLDFVSDATSFLVISYILRFTYGIAESASVCAVLGMLISLYPTRAASLIGMYGTFFGLGLALGPAVGSFLYLSGGGMALPCMLIATLGAVTIVLVVMAVPTVEFSKENQGGGGGDEDKNMSMANLLKHPSVWLPFLDNFTLQLGVSFFESMLSPFAEKEAGMSLGAVGGAFLLISLPIVFVTPVVGHVLDRTSNPVILSLYPVLGNVLLALSMLLVPMSLLGSLASPSPALVYSSCLLVGGGYTVVSVACFARGHRAADGAGFSQDLAGFLMLSGIWQFSFSSGNFVGPTVAGFTVAEWGFRSTASLLFVLYCAMVMINPTMDLIFAILRGASGRIVGVME